MIIYLTGQHTLRIVRIVMKHIDRPAGAHGIMLVSVYHTNAEAPRNRKFTITRETTPGGYWEGERVYTGRAGNMAAFKVGVPDSGEGTNAFRCWMRANQITNYSFTA
jgi:hypothetical protein